MRKVIVISRKSYFMLRGGSWCYLTVPCCASYRLGSASNNYNLNFGFRMCFHLNLGKDKLCAK